MVSRCLYTVVGAILALSTNSLSDFSKCGKLIRGING
jgi:hypothetical protein